MTSERVDDTGRKNSAMFARIAHRYDVANDVLSLGVHRAWRRRLLDAVDVQPGERCLDCATGTGEVALALARAGGVVTGLDACEPMLVEARAKPEANDNGVEFVVGDVQALPFDDASFDVVTIAWGIRNVADPVLGLAEMTRVLKPGGRLGILEFGQPDGVTGALYRLYGERVLPKLGGAVTGDVDAYAYLNMSSSTFPCGDDFLGWLRPRCAEAHADRLFAGLAWLYFGVVPGAAGARGGDGDGDGAGDSDDGLR